jgi:hypothetical protein
MQAAPAAKVEQRFLTVSSSEFLQELFHEQSSYPTFCVPPLS